LVVAIVVSGSGHDIVFSCGVLACDDHMSQKFVGQKGVVLLIIALQDLPISLKSVSHSESLGHCAVDDRVSTKRGDIATNWSLPLR